MEVAVAPPRRKPSERGCLVRRPVRRPVRRRLFLSKILRISASGVMAVNVFHERP
jgi:hypothetical protein